MVKVVKSPISEKDKSFIFSKYKNIVMVYGHFSSIHPGYIRYLKNARTYGTNLIIALKGDEGDQKRYPFSIKERTESLTLLNLCDCIIQLKNLELAEIIKEISPSVVVFGSDYKNTNSPDITNSISEAKRLKTKIIYESGESNYATTELLRNSKSEIDLSRKNVFLESCRKQSIEIRNINKTIEKFKNTSILIIGDTIIDEYAACETLGVSAEAPVLVVKELDSEIFVGGAAVVASHISQLGGNCEFVSVIGDDNKKKRITDHLKKQCINSTLFIDKSRPTTFKKRYMVENQKLFRVSKLEDHALESELEEKLINSLKEKIPNVKGVVISDFNYGVITERVLKEINKVAKKYKVKVFADSQSSSQLGYVTKFKDITLICPNEKEARLSLRNKNSGIEHLAMQLFKECNPKYLIMTLGSQGFISYLKDSNKKIVNQYFPALTSNPLDVTGAGDSLLACMALSISSGSSVMEASAISCFICNLVVESIGNKPVNAEQLIERMNEYLY